MKLRKRQERGFTSNNWLKSYHSFSFGEYFDQNWVQFRTLRVINDDRVAAGQGFHPHSHQNMEIVSYVLEGELQHKDSLGNGSVIGPNEVQRMSAGTGVSHSEFNPSEKNAVHFLQIWIFPEEKGMPPSYEQKKITHALPSTARQSPSLKLLVSREGENGSVRIHQDVKIYSGKFQAGESLVLDRPASRYGWVQIASGEGSLSLKGQAEKFEVAEGDGACFEAGELPIYTAKTSTEILYFDLA